MCATCGCMGNMKKAMPAMPFGAKAPVKKVAAKKVAKKVKKKK